MWGKQLKIYVTFYCDFKENIGGVLLIVLYCAMVPLLWGGQGWRLTRFAMELFIYFYFMYDHIHFGVNEHV